MTPEQELQRVTSFEDGNISMAINNPDDLLTESKEIKYPGYIDVVNYYHIDSENHIIENNIKASAEEISNHVVIKYPTDPSFRDVTKPLRKEFWADDNIRGGNIRTYVSYQRNIDPFSAPIFKADWIENALVRLSFKRHNRSKIYGYLPQSYNVGYNTLANQMRPMYRGSLKIIGMPFIKEYDILFLNDAANDMWGPIEVETVTQQFSAEGFTTEIVPNAVISYMHPARVLELGIMQGLRIPFLPFLGNVMDMNLFSRFRDAVGGVTTIPTGPMFGSAAALTLFTIASGYWISPFLGIGVTAATVTAGIIGANSLYNWGIGKIMGRDVVNICGLWHNMQPFVAGMEGAYKDSIQVNMMDRIRGFFDFQSNLPGMK